MIRAFVLMLGLLFITVLVYPTPPAHAQEFAAQQQAAKLLFRSVAKLPTADLTPKPQTHLQPIDPCVGHTIVNIIAHQDDDLLFINPAVQQAITRGDCVRTMYLTSGDDGRPADYITSRETGAKNAYQVMAGTELSWADSTSNLAGKIIATSTPQNNSHISLFFLHLPDGNLNGSGFASTNFSSLAHLRDGTISTLATTDGATTYSSVELVTTIQAFITRYQPSSINTLSDDRTSGGDHSDHIATGDFVNQAAAQAGPAFPARVTHFRGYSIAADPANLSPADTQQKAAAFFAYAADDPGVCTTMQQCIDTGSSYASYLDRQYSY